VIYPEVDIQRWITRFPVELVRENWRRKYPKGLEYQAPSDIFSPGDIAVIEQLRALLGGPSALGPGKPVDLLLPVLGEPPQRCCSKIGGLPYRRSGSWPKGHDEKPLSFIAQICLADSRDILNGFGRSDFTEDVLLIFQDGEEVSWGENYEYGSTLVFEWQPIGIPESELLRPEDIPGHSVRWTPTYFERLRSTEHPTLPKEIDAKADQLGMSGRYWSSKIGGVPVFQQSEEEAEGLGRFFACLHSINPTDEEFPFPNVPVSPWGDRPYDEGFLMLGDVGTLYLFAAGNGPVRWLTQCG
jgi:hypothetical protein